MYSITGEFIKDIDILDFNESYDNTILFDELNIIHLSSDVVGSKLNYCKVSKL